MRKRRASGCGGRPGDHTVLELADGAVHHRDPLVTVDVHPDVAERGGRNRQ